MTLFIQNDNGTLGTGTVQPGNASMNLMDIGNVANTDANYGENPQPAPSDLIQVTYTLNTATGPCPTRLSNLVNTNFGLNPQNVDIIIVASNGSFALNDGELLSTIGGTSLPPGFSFGGTVLNPTTSIVVLYESGGGTNCVKGQASGNYDAPNPSPAILYHELSHSFRQATNSSLSLTPPSACGASPEEMAAEVDENDMRTQLGIPLRDVTDHCGDPGCPTNCCIVASIASGSVYSSEVNSLRQVRDRFLRRSDVGFDFFEHLHYDYYGFSPEVCQLMGRSGDLTRLVELFFVKPLTLCLNLIQDYTMNGCSPKELGMRFEAGLQTSPELLLLNSDELRKLEILLSRMRDESMLVDPSLDELWRILNERASTSPYITWALRDTIEIYVAAMIWRNDAYDSAEIGKRLAARFDQWGARMPLTDIWKTLSKYAIAQELDFLKKALLCSDDARFQFGRRLAEHLLLDERVIALLIDAGFFPKGFNYER